MLDAAGELVVRINGKLAAVPSDVQHVLRARASEGPFVEAFRILARDARSGKLLVIPNGETWPAGKGRSANKGGWKLTSSSSEAVLSVATISALSGTALETWMVPPSPAGAYERDAARPAVDEEGVATAFIETQDPLTVVSVIRVDASRDQGRRIVLLANILKAVTSRVGTECAPERLEELLVASATVEFGEFKPVILQELAKISHASGRMESAASYALGAVRCAFENGEDTIAGNLMVQSRRLGIL